MSGGETRIGKHVVRLEPGGVLVMEFRGKILPGEMRALAREADTRLLADGVRFVLCDIGEVTEFNQESRYELRDRPRKLPPHFVAYVGTPGPVRVVLDLIIRATGLITGAKIGHRFFDTQAAARAWFAELRARAAPRASVTLGSVS